MSKSGGHQRECMVRQNNEVGQPDALATYITGKPRKRPCACVACRLSQGMRIMEVEDCHPGQEQAKEGGGWSRRMARCVFY